MMILPVLLFALTKQFILKTNENYWLNTLLFLTLSLGFYAFILSLFWGVKFSKENSVARLIIGFSPFFLFPFMLSQLKKIKPVIEYHSGFE